MYHPYLREEVRFLKARLLYKVKKLDEAVAASNDGEQIDKLKSDVAEIETKLQICYEEMKAQGEEENEAGRTSHE